jgi:hypothetical protein
MRCADAMLKVNKRRLIKQKKSEPAMKESSPKSNDTRLQWLQSQAQGDGPDGGAAP